jgi:hypothetical protein
MKHLLYLSAITFLLAALVILAYDKACKPDDQSCKVGTMAVGVSFVLATVAMLALAFYGAFWAKGPPSTSTPLSYNPLGDSAGPLGLGARFLRTV